jgi:hypothetical protein
MRDWSERQASRKTPRAVQVRRLEERDAAGYTAVPAAPSETDEWTDKQDWGAERFLQQVEVLLADQGILL